MRERTIRGFSIALGFMVLVIGAGFASQAWSTPLPGLTVSDSAGNPVTAYRWLVEEDRTYHVGFDTATGNPIIDPADPRFDPNWANTLAVSFHKSYMPVVAKGCVNMPAEAACKEVVPALSANRHYYVSVLARSGHSIGGAGFKTDGSGNVPPTTVYLNPYPIPTAQISILVFHDNRPINGVPDTPPEDPAVTGEDLSGFTIILEDAGGRYGASAGIQSTDVYGNPLGTTYLPNCDPYLPSCVAAIGSGIHTGPDGWAHIYNLAPGKYGVKAAPPAGQNWQQTSTIEGTPVIDAWVKANEPPFFAEFGPAGPHVFIGFVKPTPPLPVLPGGGATITGKVVNNHLSRPPDYAFYDGACFGHTTPWVGLNDLSGGGIGEGIYVAPTVGECDFSIPNVPDGNYQLVIWDTALDLVISSKGITITGGACNTPSGLCDLGNVPVFQWFHRQEHYAFNDENANGVWDPDEDPLPDVPVNLRWRDGTVYQGNVTDGVGAYAFDQVFPFFSWLVAEVGFPRLQATGVTVVADNGGPIDLGSTEFPGYSVLNPQDQMNQPDPACTVVPPLVPPCQEFTTHRVEVGPTLLQPFQGFLGQTHVFQWGKRHYPDGENGGISGMVLYDVTRDVNDPRYAAAQVWEPGIPGVTVELYDAAGTTRLATTTTDSWDDSPPTGCKWGNGALGPYMFDPDGPTGPILPTATDCYDGLRVFNQVRPGVFDGGYAFGPAFDCADFGGTCPDWLNVKPGETVGYLKPGDYVVRVVPPAGYEITKPEDKNVDFGDAYTPPAPALLPPLCVGDPALLPPYLTLHPDEQVPTFLAWTTGIYQPVSMPLCDRKQVTVSVGSNAAADFFLFTEVPVAAHAVGFILDDTQNEFDPNSPQFGEKYAPPFLPVSIRDWTGREIGRTYSDQYGVYNFLAPSTATTNVPAPSGMSPNMLTACMNDRTRPDGTPDPQHNPIYSQFCYTFQYMPGVTTYLDTPVIPIAAFAGPDQFPVDCEFADGTPRIHSVTVATNGVGGGPYIPAVDPPGPAPLQIGVAQTITINALDEDPATTGAQVRVPNPAYCNPTAGPCPAGADTVNKTVWRASGFGTPTGTLSLGDLTAALTILTWSDTQINATIPAGTPIGTVGGRQLTVTRAGGGPATRTGVTVQVGLRPGAKVVQVLPDATGNLLASPIQTAINNAQRNDLILVNPGVYNEMVVMSKPVQLQGWGEGSTRINALKQPAEKLSAWRTLVDTLVTTGQVDLLPGQEALFGGIEPPALQNEEGAGVLVLASSIGTNRFDQVNNRGARIDGFTITGADTGGGVVVNGYGYYLDISNNRIVNNQGSFGGGIRVGHPRLTNDLADAPEYTDAQNDFVRVHHNTVNQNGGLGGAGAGISMGTGSDSYQVTENWVCGNFNTGDGGGIGHIGRSDGVWVTVPNSGPQNQRVWTLTQVPLIENNTVIFNETFNQGLTVTGGGLFIGGGAPLAVGGLSPGAGNVQVNRNLIQGNGAGAGDGGGIRLARVNGQDVAANPSNAAKPNGSAGANAPPPWYAADLFNNIIVNNVAGLAGGGISLQDAVKVNIVHDTIANNDSLGTAGEAFLPNSPNQSTPQPGAGIVTRKHSDALANTGSVGAFSDPRLEDTIVWHNRKFFFHVEGGVGGTAGATVWGLCPDIGGTITGLNCPGGNTVVYDDLAVLGVLNAVLACDASCITTGANPPPQFVQEYANGSRSGPVLQPEATIGAPPAFDEGGNFIRPSYGPLSIHVDVNPDLGGIQVSNYHLSAATIPQGVNLIPTFPTLATDFDGLTRPVTPDIGADEY